MPAIRTINPFVVLALSLFIVSCCNAFELIYSNAPDVLLDEARVSLQSGDAQKAISLPEEAPDNYTYSGTEQTGYPGQPLDWRFAVQISFGL